MKRFRLVKSKFRTIPIIISIFWLLILAMQNSSLSAENILCTPDGPEWISYGNTVSCVLGLNTNNSFKLNGNVGEVIIAQSVWTSGTMRPCIELKAPDNSSVVACENVIRNRIDTTLSQSGTYTLIVDAYSGGTGSYSLDIERLVPPDENARVLPFGSSINDNITPYGDLDIFKFYGINGSHIGLKITWQSGDMRPCMQLVSPNNARHIACNDSLSNELDLTLDQTGTYAVLADVFSSGAGAYTLKLECISGKCLNIYLPIIGLPPGEEGPLGTLSISCTTKPGEEPFPEVLEIYQNVTLSKTAAGSSHFYFYSDLQEKSGPILWQPPDALQTYVQEGEKTGSYHSGWAQCETPGLCSAKYKLKFPYYNWPYDAYEPWDGRIVRCDF